MRGEEVLGRLRALHALAAELQRDVRVWYAPHPKQVEFHATGLVARERLFLAGNRVGKTLAGAAEMAFHLTGLYPEWWQGVRFAGPVQGWAASVTREATRDILQGIYLGESGKPGVLAAPLLEKVVLKSGVAGAVDRVLVRHVGGGFSTLGFKSFDQGRKSFQGTVRQVIHLDEEPPLDVLEECLLRTLTVRGHVLLTMTPLLGLTEVVQRFLSPAEGAAVAVVQAGWADAPHLDQALQDSLRAGLRPHEVQAREFGTPVLGHGRVYPVAEAELIVPRFEVPQHFAWCMGLDFGWHNPTAAVWLAYDREADVAYVVDAYVRSEATPDEHAAEILRRNARLGLAVPGVCDPSGQAVSTRDGQSLVSLYASAGLVLDLADNSVEAGLMAVLERMREGRLKVFADLEPWWREFRQYGRDAQGRVLKRHDHLLDATRYAVVSGLALARVPGGTVGPPKRRGGWMAV